MRKLSAAYRKRTLARRAKIVKSIESQVKAGKKKIALTKVEVGHIMKADLIDARDFVHASGYMNGLDFFHASSTLDGTFYDFRGVTFIIGGDYPLNNAPSGEFSASDINYAYYGMVSEALYPYHGGLISEAANVGWNLGEQAIGNDLNWGSRDSWKSSGVPYRNGIGQIGRARKWANYGVELQRHWMAN